MRKISVNIIIFSVCLLFLYEVNVSTNMIAEITTSVETDFGTYEPYTVSITPNAQPYTINSDFSNVTNFNNFSFNSNESDILQQNGFVVTPSRYKQIYSIYNYCKENETPVFVTSDSMLHTFHILYDYSLRILEVQKFYNDLDNLSKTVLQEAKNQYDVAITSNVKEAAKKNVAYFTVAARLLDDTVEISTYVADLVNSELSLIDAHGGFSTSPIFDYDEDYSQYVPRGHYTRNETLERFFKSMMWYGRIMFRLKPGELPENIAQGKAETLQAILIVKMLNELSVYSEPALDVWDRIYNPTVFFVGKTDDLNVYEYTTLIKGIWGDNFTSLPVDNFWDDIKLTDFINQALELRNPFINSSWVEDWEDVQIVTKGFRFMGQRFIPDSYMFQELVYPKVGEWPSSPRLFPRGLDIMAVLGSVRAFQILDTIYYETNYTSYTAQMDKLIQEFSSLQPGAWAQNLYWNWLYCLMPLLFEKGQGYPIFMQKQAWVDKELATALGSWAELRHDTILYAKQSYTPIGVAPVEPDFPDLIKGYIEPNPHLYARLAALVKFMRIGLYSRDLLLNEFNEKLEDLETLLLSLKLIAEKELTNQKLSVDEYILINNIGDTLENLLTFSPEVSGQIENDTDEEMAIVADVHTDGNTAQCLEEGVGYPLNIYVIVQIEGSLRLTRGAIFSYYEFTQPMDSRLTDEDWQDILKSATPPELPVWMSSFIDLEQSLYNPNPQSSYSEGSNVDIPNENRVKVVVPEGAGIKGTIKPNTGIKVPIQFIGKRPGTYTLRIFNLLGELVYEETIESSTSEGWFEWTPQDLASGVYIIHIQGPDLSVYKKIPILR